MTRNHSFLPIALGLWFTVMSGLVGAQATGAAPSATGAAVAPAQAAASSSEKTVEVNRAATVALVEGDVSIFSSAKQRRKAVVGGEIVEGESIVTGKDSELHLEMEDGGYLSVRPNTKMRIVKYQAKGEATDSGIFGLLEGGFRSVTGWIGKFNRDKYTVRTPNGTIGIRGTDHEPYVIPKGSGEGDAGTYDKVNEGGSYIQTPAGRAEVQPNQAGFASLDKGAKPLVLKDVPRHFRAGKHDRLFAGKHAEVQSRIEKRREERRSEIRQKLQNSKVQAEQRREQRQQSIREKREVAARQREETKQGREKAGKARIEKRDAKANAKATSDADVADKHEPAGKTHRRPRALQN